MLLAFGPDDLSKLAVPIGVAIAGGLVCFASWVHKSCRQGTSAEEFDAVVSETSRRR
jgi:hypothetical protein